MEKKITVALAGNPNSGKTTIFNMLTGARQHVGNYPGVTVEKKEGLCRHAGYEMTVVDLPGTYSLTAYSIEELIARNFIIDEQPDVVVDIVDASNIERNLYLATQLIEMNVPLVLAFNMSDIARRKGTVFKNITERKLLKRVKELSQQCGFPNPRQYKLHSFRHHFASLCANHHVAYRKALSWLGHSSSKMLELYYHLHDDESQKAMIALANQSIIRGNFEAQYSPFEGNLRANGQYKIEKTLQVPEVKQLVTTLSNITERAGFDLPSLCKFLTKLCLQLNWNKVKDLDSLVHLLFLHGFLLSCDVI